MIKLLAHKGLKFKHYHLKERTVFYNDQMLNDNIIICQDVIRKNNKTSIVITVKHYNEFQAIEWIMCYADTNSIAGIQIYRIILDIYEMYNDFPLVLFLEMLTETMIGSTHPESQTPESKKEMTEAFKMEIDLLKNDDNT
ncbi:hypothetical protein [Paenibacillus sp. LPE1-1-1.1]|uniref:hypothetical protein n=1 Tax=Paenibacillus sp. LPE1-1-1.1 TaxID=3135230 RepID=UPI00342AEEF4